MSRFADRGPLVVGHRGGRGEGWPAENTLAAFERARREGARAVELDVRTCRTGEVVVFHDATLVRMTGGRDVRAIASMSGREVSAARVGGEGIPMLREVLAWADASSVSINVELKHDVADRVVLARGVAALLRESRADVLVSSFDPMLLVTMAALSPRVPRALLTYRGQRAYAAVLRELARPALLFALHVERTESDPVAIRRWKRRGLRVGVWTVNEPIEARDLAKSGADFLITDSPGRLLER